MSEGNENEELKKEYFSKNPLSEEERFQVLEGEVTMEGIAKRMKNYKNIICLCGAGISTNSGIPDFRSKGGFYETVDLKKHGLSYAEEMLTVKFFKKNPFPYYERCKYIMKAQFSPTKTHEFLVTLHRMNKLLRCYTQNIDGLEQKAGLPKRKVIQCHGGISTCSCVRCGQG